MISHPFMILKACKLIFLISFVCLLMLFMFSVTRDHDTICKVFFTLYFIPFRTAKLV